MLMRFARMFNAANLEPGIRDDIILVAHRMLASGSSSAEVTGRDFLANVYHLEPDHAKIAFAEVYKEFGGEWFAVAIMTAEFGSQMVVFFLTEIALQEKWDILPEGVWTHGDLSNHLRDIGFS